MRWVCCTAVMLSACYSPKIVGGAPCDPSHPTSCPDGETCVAMGSRGVCTSEHGGSPVDAAAPDVPDVMVPDGGVCLGNRLLGSICLAHAPTGPVTLTTATINTATVVAGGCTEIHPQNGGPSLCLIVGTTIDVPAGVTIRAIGANPGGSTATATNPLVLIATQSITIGGTIDVSSHFGETVGGGAPALGAGARTPTGCFVAGVDGQAGNGSNGGGGAAGGSFGALGGNGGTGGNNGGTPRGTASGAAAPTVLFGGCPGGKGGDGAGAPAGGDNTGGAGGNPGGAIYLLAGDAITISGKINASGAGGAGGGPGFNSSGGGGGGGAGGMIGLEAARINSTGVMFAHGGGGGGGGGDDGRNDAGKPGLDPSVVTAPAAGGTATNNGGKGGAGAFMTTAPTVGNNGGGNGAPQCAGGGGGGAIGVIRVFGGTVGGTVSPPPT